MHNESGSSAPPRPSLAVGLIVFVLVFVASAVALCFEAELPYLYGRAAAVVFVITAGPLLVLAHEGGHYAVARLIGWRVALFTWGGYTIRLRPWRIRHGAPPFSDAWGAVVAVPTQESRWGYIAVFAGGPAANLAIALLSAVTASALETEAAAFFWLLAALSLLAGVTNLFPWRKGSDGAQIVSILGERDLTARTLMARLAEQMIGEVRPRDWPPSLMQSAMRLTLWTPYSVLLLLLYVWHMDRGEVDAARRIWLRTGDDSEVICERAFFSAFVDGDAQGADGLLTRAGADPSCLRFWRAKAAIAVQQNDFPLAREAIRMARIIAGRDPYATVWDREVLDQLELRCTA
ncbi:Zn-dependent protease [Rhizomicrobium palustre]|uniref:Zn-dependent protease n=2 Tax=Rhizomicrobium palustre TaxID=189966 RepID=A0A846N0Q1_9PROT|nr:M50 family metallopeptidase [Rhizomicrobium palustre]NIK88747.1 Zn-dependent protease [Rhizomicrobium palustre]